MHKISASPNEINIDLHRKVPGFVTDPSMMFAYPSHASNLFAPVIERINVPEKHFLPLDVDIKATVRHTGARQPNSLKEKVYKRLSSFLEDRSTVDLSGKFIFDARFDTDKNIGHVIQNIAAPVFFAQQQLSEHLNQDIKIHVILKKDASQVARQAYELMGIPTICTDNDVYGYIVDVSRHDLFAAHPQIFNIDFKGYNPTTPERIFIPRRGNREIINNDEVRQFLEAKGFTTYYFEDLTHSEKWSLVKNAKVAVVNHGAATTNFVFNRRGLESPQIPGSGLHLIEIFSPNFTLMPGYSHLAKLFNGKWCAVRGQILPETIRFLDFNNQPRNTLKSPMKDPFRVDLKTLELALEYLDLA
ncbi:MAG: glycosyltransferase family 61 protein [Tolypothrix sp. T3-bin4]|nr:glycosyltransferase family 61 protein [Tolypothrix sp. T3-bin4]